MSFPRLGDQDREILRLAVPAAGALIAEPLYVLADTAIVGRLGTPELGGLSVAATVLLTSYTLFIFLAYGTTGTVARLLGAGRRDEAAEEGVQGLWLAVLIGLGLVVLGLLLAEPAVGLVGASGEVRGHALTYLRISLVGVPFLLVVLAGTGYLRGLQDTRTPLVVALATAAANLVLEVVFVLGFDWGLAGSAWSTVLVQAVAAGVYVRVVLADARRLGVGLRPDVVALRRLGTVSRDLFVRTAALRLSLATATAVAARIGVAELAAHEVAFQLWGTLALVLDGLAIAGQAMVGRLLGAGDGVGARRAGSRIIAWGVGTGVVLALAVLALRPVLPGLFTEDPAVRHLIGFLLLWVAVLQPVNAVVFVLDGLLIGAGDLRFLAWAMVGAAVAFVPVAGSVLALDLGIGWLWAAIAVLMTARLLALGARFLGDGWVRLGARAA